MKSIFSIDIVAQRKAELALAFAAVKARGTIPRLAAAFRTDDPAVASYVAAKRRHTEEVGGAFETLDLHDAHSGVAARMRALCDRPDVHGVIVVMSSNPGADEIDLPNLIPAHKDVDGLSACNLGAMLQNGPAQRFIAPATPQSCLLLAASRTELKGKRVVVIGRGRTVGRPLANLLVSAGATVTVCHSATKDIPAISREADVVFLATGQPRMFGREYFRAGQVIIDAGIGFIDGKPCGDADFNALEGLDVEITPVPGGVGPLTSVLILENLLKLVEIQGAA
jgi:methylenetetrahydrofolate dehydrogenase (NADP+)/methenyltetrahydrofolate cyclohydrolase